MRISRNYTLREIAGEKVLMKQGIHGVDMTKIISMNPTAHDLWIEFEGKEFTSGDVSDYLYKKYGISIDTAMADSVKWIEDLKACGAIEE